MSLKFNKEEHKYYDGDKELLSVTQLLHKHKLAPDYTFVKSDVLDKAAQKGTLIHEEIQKYIEDKEIGFTDELADFRKLCSENGLKPEKSEQMFAFGNLAGTVDLIFADGSIGDIKTGTVIDKTYCTWQLSLYKRLMEMNGRTVTDLYIFHLSESKAELKHVTPISDEEIDKLIESEERGEMYKAAELVIADDSLMPAIRDCLSEIKRLDEEKKRFNEKLVTLMEQQGIKSYENDYLKITYVAPTERKSFDSKAFLKDNPQYKGTYEKKTKVASSVRITLKENKE